MSSSSSVNSLGAFVRAWKEDTLLKGVSSATGDYDGVDRSEVIRRHLSAGAGTPLYSCTPET